MTNQQSGLKIVTMSTKRRVQKLKAQKYGPNLVPPYFSHGHRRRRAVSFRLRLTEEEE